MPDWISKRILITVRTYPVPARSSIEASCTAGITRTGEWVRLFPVPYRLMDEERRFRKWQWINARVLRAQSDSRPESYKLDIDSIQIGETVGTRNGWRSRLDLMAPLRKPSMCEIQREREASGAPTLGVFRPAQIRRLLIEPAEIPGWTPAQLAILRQDTLFQKAPARTLEKIPFDFKYEFRCNEPACRGHTMMCTDWEMAQSYRGWQTRYRGSWESFFRRRYETEMIEKNDTHFFVGTIHQHPGSWIIIGLFYPPRWVERDLFDPIS